MVELGPAKSTVSVALNKNYTFESGGGNNMYLSIWYLNEPSFFFLFSE